MMEKISTLFLPGDMTIAICAFEGEFHVGIVITKNGTRTATDNKSFKNRKDAIAYYKELCIKKLELLG